MTSTKTSLGLLGFAFVSFGLVACASTTNGGSDDAGMVPPVPDATVFPTPDATGGGDTTLPQNDAMSIFGGGDTGGGTPDATTNPDGSGADGGSGDGPTGDATPSEGGATDAGAKDSGAKDSSTPVDTGPPPACTVVTPNTSTSGDMPCAAPVTGMCGAGSLMGFNATPHAPTAAKQGVCTTAEMQTLFTNCLNGGTGACTQDACYKCIFSNQADSAWGPVVLSPDNLAQMNVGGCLQLLEPCNSACAATFEEQLECEQAACGTNCPIATSITGYNNCATGIDTCVPGCASYYSGAGSCLGNITGAAHPGSVCLANTDFQTQFNTIVPLFCGN